MPARNAADEKNPIQRMLNALRVVKLDQKIRSYLKGYDPKALDQVEDAVTVGERLGQSDPRLSNLITRAGELVTESGTSENLDTEGALEVLRGLGGLDATEFVPTVYRDVSSSAPWQLDYHQDEDWRVTRQATNNWTGQVIGEGGDEVLDFSNVVGADFLSAYTIAKQVVDAHNATVTPGAPTAITGTLQREVERQRGELVNDRCTVCGTVFRVSDGHVCPEKPTARWHGLPPGTLTTPAGQPIPPAPVPTELAVFCSLDRDTQIQIGSGTVQPDGSMVLEISALPLSGVVTVKPRPE